MGPLRRALLKLVVKLLFGLVEILYDVQVVAIISIAFIVVSTVCLTINTLPSVHGHDPDTGEPTDSPYLAAVETACIGWFTLEYVGRLWASPNKWQFFKVCMLLCPGCSWPGREREREKFICHKHNIHI